MDMRMSYSRQKWELGCIVNNIQFFAIPQLNTTRALNGNSVPVIAWVTGGALTIIRLFGPKSMGSLGNFGAKIDAEAVRTGKPPEEISDQVRSIYMPMLR
jgi:hypothetical protein